MRAWTVHRVGPASTGPLRLVERPDPVPRGREVRLRVSVCGVCRTDLHLAEGDLTPRHPGVVPGHEVVGVVDAVGDRAERVAVGDRLGIAWLRSTCGRCRFCRRGDENLCLRPSFTGWDHDGGFAERAVVDERYAYRLPAALDAGIIGYRALRRSALPAGGGRLGIYGFGASAHITAQIAIAEGATVHVLTRSEGARRLATSLGAASVGAAADSPPEPLDAAILFAPAGELVLPALAALDRGGTLAIAGIHLSDIPALDYQRHLFQERQVRSVTANTRRDGEELLRLATRYDLRPTVAPYAFERAGEALVDLAGDRVTGAAVLQVR
jgi:alcohol dehydrogenase, propanol-preferring